jgi:hypothetical protein
MSTSKVPFAYGVSSGPLKVPAVRRKENGGLNLVLLLRQVCLFYSFYCNSQKVRKNQFRKTRLIGL